jgi:hypothetical protein
MDDAVIGGSGFEVDTGALTDAAEEAESLATELSTLCGRIGPAIAIGTRGGLRIGAAVGRAESSWTTLLDKLAGQVTGAASSLRTSAAAYAQAERTIVGSVGTTGRELR